LREYQQKNGLAVDGIAGPDTFFQMGLYELVLLKVGTHGETVKKLQTALGIPRTAISARHRKGGSRLPTEERPRRDGMAGR